MIRPTLALAMKDVAVWLRRPSLEVSFRGCPYSSLARTGQDREAAHCAGSPHWGMLEGDLFIASARGLGLTALEHRQLAQMRAATTAQMPSSLTA